MALFVATPPAFESLWERPAKDLLRVVQAPPDPRAEGEYLHWDKVRHLDPPDGLSSEDWWLQIKLNRRGALRSFPLRGTDGTEFTYALPDGVLRSLHQVDQRCSGSIAMDEVVTGDSQAKRQYLVNSLMEEAIGSSQLEGATTSRRVAKELLRSGREPRTRGERMIVNTYKAMLYMRDSVGRQLSPDVIFAVHRILTEGTLDNPDAAGRLQRPDEDRVAVLDRDDGTVLHRPPPAEELPTRMRALCDFANAAGDDSFVHPVVKAILLHFWMGYDHPFEDGNGRTARAIFYWYLRNQGYWLIEYLSISRILRQAPGEYSRAYLFSETDEGDVTYFLVHQLNVIERAVEELHAYLRKEIEEVKAVEQIMRDTDGLNHRQLAVLSEALRNPARTYSFTSHAGRHGVTHETARNDITDLERRGFLYRSRTRRPFQFAVPEDLPERLKALA